MGNGTPKTVREFIENGLTAITSIEAVAFDEEGQMFLDPDAPANVAKGTVRRTEILVKPPDQALGAALRVGFRDRRKLLNNVNVPSTDYIAVEEFSPIGSSNWARFTRLRRGVLFTTLNRIRSSDTEDWWIAERDIRVLNHRVVRTKQEFAETELRNKKVSGFVRVQVEQSRPEVRLRLGDWNPLYPPS